MSKEEINNLFFAPIDWQMLLFICLGIGLVIFVAYLNWQSGGLSEDMAKIGGIVDSEKEPDSFWKALLIIVALIAIYCLINW